MKITPVLIVEKIENSLPFWIDRMGFEKVVEVPDEGSLGFAILTREGAELMLQSAASVQKDEPKFVPQAASRVTSLFIEVRDFDAILSQLNGYPIVMPDRTTFYGMREVGVFEPSGHIVVFAARVG